MPAEPLVKRAVAFFDGQNLFYAAKDAFGYTFPNYDPTALARSVAASHGWTLEEVRFYTGVPAAKDSPSWNHFWGVKLGQMGRDGVKAFSRPLRYRNQRVRLPDGSERTVLVGQEKGIDVRLALDVIRCVVARRCDVAMVFSQDQDLSEVAPAADGQPRSDPAGLVTRGQHAFGRADQQYHPGHCPVAFGQ
jgi:uncharacterized LabA/DUF88 family protein